jgi:hypothetical protein
MEINALTVSQKMKLLMLLLLLLLVIRAWSQGSGCTAAIRLSFLEVPTVAARSLHVLSDARDPSSERWNF